MAPRTRSKPGAKTSEQSTDSESTKSLPSNDLSPPKICILPKDASPDARILNLPNPATSQPNRYFFCPEKGIYEFTKLAAPRSTPRSWLVAPRRSATVKVLKAANEESVTNQNEEEHPAGTDAGDVKEDEQSLTTSGYITSHADLLIATPLDPLFMILPALAPSNPKEKQMFLSVDDHLDNMNAGSYHLRHALGYSNFKDTLQSRMTAVCDVVDAGDEKMYRLSSEKLVQEMLAKAKRMVEKGLPASLEDRFVRRALEPPLLSIKKESPNSESPGTENIAPVVEDSQTTTDTTPESQDSVDSQSSIATKATSVTEASQTIIDGPVNPTISASEEVSQLLRIRTALRFMSSSYLPTTLRSKLEEGLKTTSQISFASLDAHLSHLDALRQEAQALRSLSDNVSRKRTMDDDEEAVEARAEKKRKKEEEELRKKNESRAAKALKKVNTTGMKKLSAFFAPKPQGKK